MKSTIPIFSVDSNGNTQSSGEAKSKKIITNQVTISAVKYVELGNKLPIESQNIVLIVILQKPINNPLFPFGGMVKIGPMHWEIVLVINFTE